MGVGVFARLQHTPGIANGTRERELRTGSRSVPQYGIRIRDRGPALPAITIPGNGRRVRRLGCSPRVGCMSQVLGRAFTARATVQERSPCPMPLSPELMGSVT